MVGFRGGGESLEERGTLGTDTGVLGSGLVATGAGGLGSGGSVQCTGTLGTGEEVSGGTGAGGELGMGRAQFRMVATSQTAVRRWSHRR